MTQAFSEFEHDSDDEILESRHTRQTISELDKKQLENKTCKNSLDFLIYRIMNLIDKKIKYKQLAEQTMSALRFLSYLNCGLKPYVSKDVDGYTIQDPLLSGYVYPKVEEYINATVTTTLALANNKPISFKKFNRLMAHIQDTLNYKFEGYEIYINVDIPLYRGVNCEQPEFTLKKIYITINPLVPYVEPYKFEMSMGLNHLLNVVPDNKR